MSRLQDTALLLWERVIGEGKMNTSSGTEDHRKFLTRKFPTGQNLTNSGSKYHSFLTNGQQNREIPVEPFRFNANIFS